ncbi:MAG TPA: IPT/TIG domain-containing protein, partial [Candidatus Paceibacterota bacterium]|nr:IPT/TIG domain-containing protein [Candidatus Paceibacterota bacterium]
MHWFQMQFASFFLVPLFAVAGLFGIHHPAIELPFLATSTTPVATTTPDEPVMCTMEAMQCPDGSWVGRSGPHCEFVCPGAPATSTSTDATTSPSENPAPASAAPVIYSITPRSGPVGTQVSITGFGFTKDNIVHFGGGAIAHVPI